MYSSNLPALCRKRDLWRDLAFIWWAGGKFISFHPSLTFFCCYRWFYLDEFLNIFKKSVNNLKLFKKADSFMEKKSRERRGLDLWILWRWTEFPSALFFWNLHGILLLFFYNRWMNSGKGTWKFFCWKGNSWWFMDKVNFFFFFIFLCAFDEIIFNKFYIQGKGM